MPIRRLLYTSTSCLEPGELTVAQQVEAIAARAAVNNRNAGITGMLAFVDGQFIQVIEGDSSSVEAAFERICCNFSHSNVKLIDLIAVKTRMFEGWAMARLSEADEPGAFLDEELRNIRFLLGINARIAVEKMHECLLARTRQPVPLFE